MNAYEKRRNIRAQIQRDKRELERAEYLWDMDRLCRRYERAHFDMVGTKATAEYNAKTGWFIVSGTRTKYRMREFLQRIDYMLAQARVNSMNIPEDN